MLADGTVFWGRGVGATGTAVGEVCFNTSMTGYQEILTDPSYAGQIITFTFPHIGNVGANHEDIETITPAARGLVVRSADHRAVELARRRSRSTPGSSRTASSGICGRRYAAADPAHPRRRRAQRGHRLCSPTGALDLAALRERGAAWPGLEGMDLAKEVTCRQTYEWDETLWQRERGYGRQEQPRFHVVAVDYGAKRNILRCSPRTAAGSPWCRRPPRPRTSCATSPTASSCRTARATRRRPATTRCR